MTFSLRPRSSSVLPEMAASVSTRVVSWNDAAEMKLSVDNEAFVMPSSTGFAVEAVDLLHLVHEVALQLAVAEHRQVVVRVGRPVHERLARPHAVALVDADVLAARDQVLARLAIVGADDDLTHALHEATHLDA